MKHKPTLNPSCPHCGIVQQFIKDHHLPAIREDLQLLFLAFMRSPECTALSGEERAGLCFHYEVLCELLVKLDG